MKIGIYGASGDVEIQDSSIDFIAVDRGYEYLLQKQIKPIEVIGDFDSIDDTMLILGDITTLPSVKDDTDTAIAIDRAVDLGYDEIDLYGVTGGRLDHFIAVLRLLVQYPTIKICIYDNQNKIYSLHKGNHRIKKLNYQYISFFSITNTYISIEDVKYPLNDYYLQYADALCVSNEIIGKDCQLKITDSVFVVQSNDKF